MDVVTGGALEDSIDVAIRPYTVLKSVSVEGGGNPIPGKYLRFQIDIDVSDYESFQNAVLNDVLSDGLTFDMTDDGTIEHVPVLKVDMNGETFFVDLSTIDEVAAIIQGDYTQALTFQISQALINSGYNAILSAISSRETARRDQPGSHSSTSPRSRKAIAIPDGGRSWITTC